MEQQVQQVPIYINVAVLISASAAAVSAICALLTFLFSRKLSRRDMVDTLKLEILRVVSTLKGRNKWRDTVEESYYKENKHIGVSIKSLSGLLEPEYQKDKWVRLFSVAIQELKNEGNDSLLGMGDKNLIDN